MTNTKQVACLAPALLSALVLHGCGTPGDEDIYRCGSWDPDTDSAELCQNAGNCVYTSGVAVACQNPDQQSDPTAANAVLGNQEFCYQIDGAGFSIFYIFFVFFTISAKSNILCGNPEENQEKS